MNVALIIAGGSGHRMGQDIPKQFINVYDKPVLIYTLEGFQRHPMIDAIELVCIDGWHDVARAYAKQFGIDKLKWVISGGETGQESIRNGVYNLEDKCAEEDIVVIHDGIRPLVDATVLSDVIRKCEQYGNGVTSMPYNEQIFMVDDDVSTSPANVDIEAESTRSITRAIRKSGRVSSIDGTILSYTNFPFSLLKAVSTNRRPKPPRK